MNLFLVLIVVLLIGLTTAAVLGKIGGFMADPTSSQSFAGLPAGPLSAGAIAQLHFDQALRGYRMEQVDEVIDALSARVLELESAVDSWSAAGPSSPRAGESPEVGNEPGGSPDLNSDPSDPSDPRDP